jgi:hypothetical protein
MKSAKKKETNIEIMELKVGIVRCNILGTSPMIMHRFPLKAWQELLYPGGPKNRAEKATNLKHDPVAEFRDVVYRNRDDSTPALLHVPSGAFSRGMADAALDIPGATKSQITRLTKVITPHINLFGIPKLYMAMVRSSDMARTPDVRTRAIFPRWACTVDVQFVSTLTKEGQIVNLLAAAGLIIGLGDWRSQKGGVHGGYRIVGDKDAEFRDIVKSEGRKAQTEALRNPVAYDYDSEELLAWFHAEAARREREIPSGNVELLQAAE